jgi:hypothetical protein
MAECMGSKKAIQPIDKSSIQKICCGQVIVDLCSAVKEVNTTALLHYWTTTLLYNCTTALLHYCITALLHYYTTTLLHCIVLYYIVYCTTALLHYCTTALLHYYTTALYCTVLHCVLHYYTVLHFLNFFMLYHFQTLPLLTDPLLLSTNQNLTYLVSSCSDLGEFIGLRCHKH